MTFKKVKIWTEWYKAHGITPFYGKEKIKAIEPEETEEEKEKIRVRKFVEKGL